MSALVNHERLYVHWTLLGLQPSAFILVSNRVIEMVDVCVSNS